MEHYTHDHRTVIYLRDEPNWVLASDADTAAVVELENIASVECLKPSDLDRAWSCRRCFKSSVLRKDSVVTHLKEVYVLLVYQPLSTLRR